MNTGEFTELVSSQTGLNVSHVEGVRVVESFQGKTAWDGIVSLFKSDSGEHFAWIDPDSEQLVFVDKKTPIDKPVDAVRAFIASRG